jgi:Ricin-type beta-trefoil lectin domain
MMRISARTDERGSLPMALLVITVGMVMSALLAPLVVRQIVTTRNLVDRNTSLNAAQAGMDVMMARVRAASEESDGSLFGLLESLPPCTLSGDGSVPGTAEKLPYQVTIEYRDQDGKALTCPTNDVPSTARVTSVGGTVAKRTLAATYVFTTSNTNIPGGQIKIDTSTLGDQCIDAGDSKTPAAGTQVTMQTCDGGSGQQFGYTSDLYLKLIYSESKTAEFGMCLDAGATHASGNLLAFQPCPSTTRVPRYQWSLDGASQFHSTNPSSGIENLCMSVTSPGQASPPSKVSLGSCNSNSRTALWRSGAGVGAGMAGDSTAQLVNYAQFSRCLDVTNQSTGSSYMIAWFCKQSPNGVVDWNQQWVHPVPTLPAIFATGNIVVTKSGVPYCLKSPLSVATNIYTTVVQCSTPATKAPDELQWTVFHDTGDYGTSYRIKDFKGNCLTPTDLTAAVKDTHSDGTSKVKVAVCNSSELQKWNAPANINKPTPLTDLIEK